MLQKIKETTAYLKSRFEFSPVAGIVLGTGLGGLVDEIDIKFTIEYKDIPNFPVSTVEGHKGALLFGILGGKPNVAMQGRFHYYEGYSMQEIVFPIRIMKMLGVEYLFVSNASGGTNDAHEIGDLMLITDHINLFFDNPLRGKNIDELGPRFPDMSNIYNKELISKAEAIGKANNIKLHKGVYIGVQGPTFETEAEYTMVKNLGADAVGMSTVPEVIAAIHAGLTCFGISVITDIGISGKIVEVSHEEVQIAAKKSEPKMTLIMKELVKSL